MKRHHYIALGALAAVVLIIVLWPRNTATPPSTDLPATDDPALNPDAPQGTDAPSVKRTADLADSAAAASPSEQAPLQRDGGEQAQGTSLPPDEARPVTKEQRTAVIDAGAEGKSVAMNQDPRMAAYRQGIKDSMQRLKPKVAECYASALRQDPSIAGTIKITFEIKSVDGGGRVVSGEVPDSEIRSPFFEACVLEKVGGAEFPEPLEGGTVKVTYPFHFDPGGGWGGDPKDRP